MQFAAPAVLIAESMTPRSELGVEKVGADHERLFGVGSGLLALPLD
jgi:hypothetical protein